MATTGGIYLTNFTDDELERTLAQMPGDFAVIREAARRFVPGGREALFTVKYLREELDELEHDARRVEELAGQVGDLTVERDQLTEANEMLNGVVEALSGAAG